MSLLKPRWEQIKPTPEEAEEMCRQVSLAVVSYPSGAIEKVIGLLGESHKFGGALFASFRVGESDVFDWFASRNRLAEYSIMSAILRRDEVQKELPELLPSSQPDDGPTCRCSIASTDGFTMESSFLLDGRIAQSLYAGGAYGQSQLDAKTPSNWR